MTREYKYISCSIVLDCLYRRFTVYHSTGGRVLKWKYHSTRPKMNSEKSLTQIFGTFKFFVLSLNLFLYATKCLCFTKQHWGSVSSKFLTVPNSRVPTSGRNSKARSRPTSCTFALNFLRRILTFDIYDLYSISLKLQALHRFTSTATAVEDITALQGGKLGKGLKQFLTDEVVNKGKGKESLVVVDQNLGVHPPLAASLSFA